MHVKCQRESDLEEVFRLRAMLITVQHSMSERRTKCGAGLQSDEWRPIGGGLIGGRDPYAARFKAQMNGYWSVVRWPGGCEVERQPGWRE